MTDAFHDLVTASITSVRRLEVLLVMHQSGPQREWSPSELSHAMHSAEGAVASDLAALEAGQLVRQVPGEPPHFVYEPGEHDSEVAALATRYHSHRVKVISLIASTPKSPASEH